MRPPVDSSAVACLDATWLDQVRVNLLLIVFNILPIMFIFTDSVYWCSLYQI